MYKVVTKRFLNDAKTICLFEIEAPLVARHAQAVEALSCVAVMIAQAQAQESV
jgi:hypothetical protein